MTVFLVHLCFVRSNCLAWSNAQSLQVETIGDTYIGVAGLPDEREDHALAVARFARDCVHKMGDLTRKLEVMLG